MTIRSWAKTIIAYTIEGEYKVYRIRKTSLQIRILYTRKYHKLYDHEKICPNELCLIIIWETDMDVIQSMY